MYQITGQGSKKAEKYAQDFMIKLSDSDLEIQDIIVTVEMVNHILQKFLKEEGITYNISVNKGN